MMKKISIFCLALIQFVAAYIVYEDTGTRYLTISADGKYIYLWQINGQPADQKFPYALPDDARLLIEPYFEDIDSDGTLDIVFVYSDFANQAYKMVLRQNGDNFDERKYPQKIDNPYRPPNFAPTPDINLAEFSGVEMHNQKYNSYLGKYRHTLPDDAAPALQTQIDIYSKRPTYNLVLRNAEEDFERYVLSERKNKQERYEVYATSLTPNTEILISLNYVEGIYPFLLATYDWLNNYSAQEFLYYYDQTPPEYDDLGFGAEVYFSPNGDGAQDLLIAETTPSDNLYYSQTVLLDIFDGPTYINSLKYSALPFERATLVWNGRDAEGRLALDKEYQGAFYIVDGCQNISRETTFNIIVDTQPPQIWQHEINGSYFTPNGDGQSDTFSVTLNISEPSRAELRVYNIYERRVRTFTVTENQTDFVFGWDGLDNDGIIENGNYTYEIVLIDRAGNTLVSERQKVFLDYKSPLVINVGAEQAAYNFNYDEVTFNFEALEPLQIALYILNTSGEIIATVNSELNVASGNHSLTWDGHLGGVLIPDGVYNYRLIVRNDRGNTNAVSGVFYADSNLPAEPNSDVTVNVYVKTANPPEPRYISANAEVKYSVNAGEFALKPESEMSIMAVTVKNIGYITGRIMAADDTEIAVIEQNIVIPAGSREYRYVPTTEPSGRYYFLTEIKDLQNQPSEIFSREEFILDREPPVITDFYALGLPYEGQAATQSIDLAIVATDNLLPITEIMFSEDNETWTNPEAYTERRNGYAQVTADGLHNIFTKVKDAAGNWSESVSISIVVDTTPPRHTGILVNGWPGGATGSTNIGIKFLAEDAHEIKTVKVSYNDAYSWVEYPYDITINYQLDTIAGAKDFYIKYADIFGNESGIFHDYVFLDRTPPWNLRAQRLSPYYTNTRNVILQITVDDDDPVGAEHIGFVNEDGTETLLPYNPSENYIWALSDGEGEKEITVTAYDHAGNYSNALKLNYVYDITPPEVLTASVAAEQIYLPTLLEPLRVLVTANEPVYVSLNVLRDGQTVYQTGQAEIASVNLEAYEVFRPELDFGWSGQDNQRRYLRGDATYNIEYQILDRAGNLADGIAGAAELCFRTGYEMASANHDLIRPSIHATSANITAEYEDDAGASVILLHYDRRDRDNGDTRGEEVVHRDIQLDFPRNCYIDAYARTDSNYSYGGVRVVIDGLFHLNTRDLSSDISAGNRFGVFGYLMKLPQGIIRTHVYVDNETDSWLVGELKIAAKKIRSNTYLSDMSLASSYHGNYDSTDQKIRFDAYNNLAPGNQGSMGNIANSYVVTADNGNIYLSRNGVTINVTKYTDSGIQTAEPAMYIVKNIADRDLAGVSEYNAMENIHIVWQQKNSVTDNWRIYYAVVPFRYEELPDGDFSIMSAPVEPKIESAPAPGQQKYFIEKPLNYPNPFTDETTLTYELANHSSEVRARIYTITGKLVRTLDGLPQSAGYNEYRFDGNDSRNRPLANDIYYLVILARDEQERWVKVRSKIVKLR